MDKCSRPAALFFVRAVNQASQLTQIYQHLRHQPWTLPAHCLWWCEGMKLFKELAGGFETRVTTSDWFREDVSHRDLCDPQLTSSTSSPIPNWTTRHDCRRHHSGRHGWWGHAWWDHAWVDRHESSRTWPRRAPQVDPARSRSGIGHRRTSPSSW